METKQIAGVAGLLVAAGALLAAIVNRIDPMPRYAIHGQGVVETNYVPQYPTYAQPVCTQPVYQQPQVVIPPTYCSMYPWGYNAYITAIANTPMVYQPMNVGYTMNPAQNAQNVYTSPQVYGYDFSKRVNRGGFQTNYSQQFIRPSPGDFSQFAPNWAKLFTTQPNPTTPVQMNQAPQTIQNPTRWTKFVTSQHNPTGWTQMVDTEPQSSVAQQPSVQSVQPQVPSTAPQQFEYDFNKKPTPMPEYARTRENGATTIFRIPACYADDGTWIGW